MVVFFSGLLELLKVLLILNALRQEEDIIELQFIVLELLDLHNLVVAATIETIDLCFLDIIFEMVCSFSLGCDKNSLLVLLVGTECFEDTASELVATPGPGEGRDVSLIVGIPLHVWEVRHHDSELVNLLLNRGSAISASCAHMIFFNIKWIRN